MNELTQWIDALQCPDCQTSPLRIKGEKISCPQCKRVFEHSEGIWNFLSRRKGKKESEGGKQKFKDEKDTFPDEDAARYLEIILQYGKPWRGKRVLDIGTAECRGARFAQAGAEIASLNYDPGHKLNSHASDSPTRFPRFTGDGDSLPFKDMTFDAVFCRSVLHHFFDAPKAVREISRILKPGGTFFAIQEGFHPPHFSEEEIRNLQQQGRTVNSGYDSSRQSLTAGAYRKIFREAGLKLELIHPRWDTRREGKRLIVKPGAGICRNVRYVPEMLNESAKEKGLKGKVSRWMLDSETWRLAAHPKIFPLIRFQLLNWTQKTKIIAAKKPPVLGAMATENLWLRAVVRTQETGPVEAIWQKSGEYVTPAGSRMSWGYFYVSANDVYWGNENNPELFVKIRVDPDGRTEVNYFHSSILDIDIFSDCPYDGKTDEQDRLTLKRQYLTHSFKNGGSCSAEEEQVNAVLAPRIAGQKAELCCELAAIDDLRLGAAIDTPDRGLVSALWHLGGEGISFRGDQVAWGYFHAGPSNIPGNTPDDPLVLVKIWFDMNGSLYVNFIHASEGTIETHVDIDNVRVKKKIAVLNDRYLRYGYQR